jgi:hypothetical protein
LPGGMRGFTPPAHRRLRAPRAVLTVGKEIPRVRIGAGAAWIVGAN